MSRAHAGGPAGARMAWLAEEVVRFSQGQGVVASGEGVHEAGGGLVGRRVGFLLLEPLQVSRPANATHEWAKLLTHSVLGGCVPRAMC